MLSIPIDPTSTIPMYEQIYTYIKQEIIDGNLPAGTKLPSTRSLASYIQVSRNTIDMAYGQLLSEGYIEAQPKRGYYINEIHGLKVSQVTTPPPPSNKKKSPKTSTYQFDFSPFSIDLKHFPFHTWQKLLKSSVANHDDIFLLGDNQGDVEFRTAIWKYIHQSRGVNCSIDQIVIGAGVDYLLQILSQLFSIEEVIAMENPAYKQAYQVFEGLGFKTVSVPVTTQGIDIKKLCQTDAKIVYVTPSHQYPLGAVMPIKKRLSLLDWANKEEGRYIIEDDHDSEFRYKGKPIPSLQGIDTKEKVIYMGTFSRSIAPAIRIGYMVLPKPLLTLFQQKLKHYSSTVSRLDQRIMTTFMEEGYYERHLNRMRQRYKAKHDVMLNGLRQSQGSITVRGEHAGLHLVMEIHTSASEDEILTLAKEHGIRLYPLSVHYVELPPSYKPSFLMGYANLSEEAITQGLIELDKIITKLPK